jgi:hypothetical protein
VTFAQVAQALAAEGREYEKWRPYYAAQLAATKLTDNTTVSTTATVSQLLETDPIRRLQELFDEQMKAANKPCPSCGHCPACGRSAQPVVPYFQPYNSPYWWGTPAFAAAGTTYTSTAAGDIK